MQLMESPSQFQLQHQQIKHTKKNELYLYICIAKQANEEILVNSNGCCFELKNTEVWNTAD